MPQLPVDQLSQTSNLISKSSYAVALDDTDLASKLLLHLPANLLSTAVHPDNCIVQGLATGFVPNNCSFPLIGYAKCFDV